MKKSSKDNLINDMRAVDAKKYTFTIFEIDSTRYNERELIALREALFDLGYFAKIRREECKNTRIEIEHKAIGCKGYNMKRTKHKEVIALLAALHIDYNIRSITMILWKKQEYDCFAGDKKEEIDTPQHLGELAKTGSTYTAVTKSRAALSLRYSRVLKK